MRTSSSAYRTCRACSSASEYTATVLMPSSRHATIMRMAISPRFAIRIFLNIRFYGEQPLAVLHGLTVLDVDLDDVAVKLRVDLVHQFHGFDDAQHLPLFDGGADIDERFRAGLCSAEEGADDGRFHDGEINFVRLHGRRTRHRLEGCGCGGCLRGCLSHRLNHRHGVLSRYVHQRAFLDLDLEPFALELELAELVLAHHVQNAIDLVKFHAYV